MLTFAEFLAKRRAALGLSMTELAAHLLVTPQYISLLEAGKCNPSKRLQDRCARFFDEDVEYIRFLAQPMSEEQKRALLRTPSALPFLSRRADGADVDGGPAGEAVQADAEDAFIQQLLAPVEQGVSGEAGDFFQRLLDVLSGTDGGSAAFSTKAQAWSAFYRELLRAQTGGIAAARDGIESLFEGLHGERVEAYPDVLRLRVADSLSQALGAEGEWERAGEVSETVARLARLIEDAERALQGYRQAAAAYAQVGRPDLTIRMYRAASGPEDMPAPIKARLYMEQAVLEFNLANPEASVDPVKQAVRIWRLRSLDVENKTAELVASQMVGLHVFVELGRRDEARLWLGRIRSTLARVRPEDIAPSMQEQFAAASDLESAGMMVQQGRWNHAWKNLDDVQRRYADGRFAFDDADDGFLCVSRLLLLKARVAVSQRRNPMARELVGQADDHAPLSDAVRQYGRRSALRLEGLRILELAGDPDQANEGRALLLHELDPASHAETRLRNLCGTDQIGALRARVRDAMPGESTSSR